MRVAILLAGRIKGWEYTKESLKSLQDKYKAVFFVSLNAEAPDESTNAFCQYFNLSPEQIVYIPTQTPEKYRQFRKDGTEHNFYSQWFHVRSAFDLCKEYCLQKNTMFDVVIKYRSEIQSETILEIADVQPKRFYCPVHPAYQTNDQLAYGDFQTMEAYSRLVNFYEFFYTNKMLLYSGGIPRPTECVLFDYLNILANYDKIDIIYIDFQFYLDARGRMRVAVLLAGRIKGWESCKEDLKNLQNNYNATFFVSLNAEYPDESATNFCEYFNITSEQIVYIPTQTPEKYVKYYSDGRKSNLYSQWFHVKSAMQVLNQYSIKHAVQFECVVKYRADIKSESVLIIESPLQSNRIYCPIDLSYQTNDQIAYGDLQTMRLYSNLVDFFEYFYENNMFMYGEHKHLIKPVELFLFEYICILAQITEPKIDIIYFDFKYYLHQNRHLLD